MIPKIDLIVTGPRGEEKPLAPAPIDLRKLARGHIKLVVKDKDGNIKRVHAQESHSWVKNAYNLIACAVGCIHPEDNAQTAITRVSAAAWAGDIVGSSMQWAIESSVTNGILVGSGTGAENFTDYAIGTLIQDGATVGKLQYQAMADPSSISYNGGTKVLTITHVRTFYNAYNGVDCNVNEVVMVNYCGNLPVMLARDKLGATVPVAYTETLEVTYTITFTYPE